MLKSVLGAATAALLLSSVSASANASIEEIKKRAAEINELKALVQSADPALRLAAIDTMQNSDDLAMKEMAFSAGINASDESVVALTIRNRFSEIDNFSITFEDPSENENATKVFNEFGGRLMVQIRTYNKEKGTFKNTSHVADHSNYAKMSTISGLNLFVETRNCQGSFKLADDLLYKGTITCDKQKFPASISLF